ncbi:MAG: GNAT family N-acetyltransferase [Actinomycetia bacterium]|nr:GNAT family N-acetyltransferase [Actinomycetes bacterium]
MPGSPFEPIRTSRLLLRAPRLEDLEALVERRNDPRVADLQSWPTPFLAEDGRALLAGAVAQGGPADGQWWMITVANPEDTDIYGDLAVHLSNAGRTAEIGFTLATEHWGGGYASEGAVALVAYLFEEIGVSRVSGMLHPDNLAAARVLERLGMRFEGHTRLSYWVGDENSDDWLYGLTRQGWLDWGSRPVENPEVVELVPIDADSEAEICRLETHKSQERLVAPVARSYANALFPAVVDGAAVVPWMRAVRADGEWVGFMLVALTTEHHPEPYLWRLLVDRRHQRRGIGNRVLDLLVDELSAHGDSTMTVSWAEGPGSPRPFYQRYGFDPTGNIIEGETEARLSW